jgi:hypothetical protein
LSAPKTADTFLIATYFCPENMTWCTKRVRSMRRG